MQILQIEQGSPEWFQARLGLPTMSCMGRIATAKTAALSAQSDEYIGALIAERHVDVGEQFSSYWMERGIELEREARAWYELKHDCDVAEVGIIVNKGAGYSPDGLIGESGCLEIKCPKPSTHIKYLLNGELPDVYKGQVHGGLVVSERRWADFVSYCPQFEPFCIRVVRDEFTAKVESALEAFIARLDAARRQLGL